MSEEQALGLSDIFLKPVLMRMIANLQQKSVDGVSGNGDVHIAITGNIGVAKVTISPDTTRDVPTLERLVAEATNDAFQKARELVRVELRRSLGNIPWIDDLFAV